MRGTAPHAGYFLLFGQKKVTKENAARMTHFSCASRPGRGASRRDFHVPRDTCAILCAPLRAFPVQDCDAQVRHTGYCYFCPVRHARASQALALECPKGRVRKTRGDRGAGKLLLSPQRQSEKRRKSMPLGRRFFWLLWICACPGANPSGALRASKFVPDKFVFGQAKTNSPGASLDRRRRAQRANPMDGVCKSNSPAGRDPHLKSPAAPAATTPNPLARPTSSTSANKPLRNTISPLTYPHPTSRNRCSPGSR